MPASFRRINDSDDIEKLTELIHAAYLSHAKSGLKYWGTHQSLEDTAKRFKLGLGFIAEKNGEYIGTATLRAPQSESKVALYQQQHVWSLSQFCISPKYQGQGYGKALHDYIAATAASHGATVLALDTAAPATALIAMYQHWGYQIVGNCDWRPHTNYTSQLMALQLQEYSKDLAKMPTQALISI